jgi:hypothetical protein
MYSSFHMGHNPILFHIIIFILLFLYLFGAKSAKNFVSVCYFKGIRPARKDLGQEGYQSIGLPTQSPMFLGHFEGLLSRFNFKKQF